MTKFWIDNLKMSCCLYDENKLVYLKIKDETEAQEIVDNYFSSSLDSSKVKKVVEFKEIRRLIYNEKKRALTLELPEKRSQVFTFQTKEERDELFQILKNELYESEEVSKKQYSAFTASFAPIGTALFFAAMTFIFANPAPENVVTLKPARSKLFKDILEFIGPTGVYIIGGIAISICITVLIGRVKNPPVMIQVPAKK